MNGEHRRSVDALVLRSRKVNESDRLLDLLAADGSLIQAKAKYAAKSRKRFGGALEPLVHGTYALARKQVQWGWMIEQAMAGESFQGLRGELGAFYLASYLCELLLRTLHRDEPLDGVHDLTSFALHWLERGEQDLFRVKVFFELRLLGLLGFLAPFEGCVVCGRNEADGWLLDEREGTWTCTGSHGGTTATGRRFRPGDRRALEDLAFGELDRVLRGRWSPEQRRVAGALAETMVRRHLAVELRSAAFLKPFLGPESHGG